MSNFNKINENKPIYATSTKAITTDTVVHSPKRRSLSSYLSKLHTKKMESNVKEDIKPLQNDIFNTTNKSSKEKSVEPLSEKIESADILKASIMSFVNENRIKTEKEENEKKIADAKDETKLHVDDSKIVNSPSQEKGVKHTTINNSYFTPFSREELKSVLKEPQIDYDSINSKSSSISNAENHESNSNEDNEKPFSSLLEQNTINSDTETPRGSPIKVRRGRLIRGDKLQTLSNVLNYSTIYNESDSELSDINDNKDININSSFLNGNSMKDDKEAVSSFNKGVKSKPKSRSNYNSNNSANSKGSRNKKSVYRDFGGRTRLQIACDKGKIDVVKKILAEASDNPDSNIDINDQDNAGNTPLHEAALNGHLDIVKLLVDHGANVNIQSFEYFKDTPLIDASANGHLEVVEYLLSKGADPTVINAKGLTAYEAIEEDSDLDEHEKELVGDIKDTLRRGTQAWINARRHNNDKSMGHNLQSPSYTYRRDFKNNARSKNNMISDFNGVTSNDSNDDDDKYKSHSHYHHEDTLLNHKPNKIKNDIEFLWTDLTSKTGKEKLMQASKEGNLVYVGQYLENGGRIDFKAFIESVKFGHEDIASLFLAFGAQVNKLNKDDYTPLMVSVGRGHFGTVKLLLEAGADPTIKNKKGYDALFYSKNSPLGVVDDDEIALLIKSIKLHGGMVESTTDGIKEEKKEYEVKEKQNRRREEKKINKENDKTHNHNHDLLKNKSKKKSSDKDSTTIKTNDSVNRIFDDDITVKKESGKSQKEVENVNLADNNEDEDEDATIPTSRYRHTSPSFSNSIPSKRSLLLETNENDSGKNRDNEGDNSTDKHIDKKVKYNDMESERKKQERLKAEEDEYLQRKLENKRRKELELIQKLQEDEKKRVEEKEKQKFEEAKKLEQVFKEKELELERKEKRLEIEKRRRIRNMYPLGLKLIKFNGELDATNLRHIPIYYIVKDSIRYVFDLQLLLILRDSQIITKILNRQDITVSPIINVNERLQLWNILKPQFLFGELNKDNEYMNIFHSCSLSQRLQFENEEYKKFNELPMNWIRWDELVCKTDLISSELKRNLEKNMTELFILSYNETNKKQSMISVGKNSTPTVSSSIEKTLLNISTVNTDKHRHVKKPSLMLPINLQHRYRITNLLQHEKFTEFQPMW